MSVAILVVSTSFGKLHIKEFALSAPKSVKDHVKEQIEAKGGNVRWTGGTLGQVDVLRLELHMLVSLIEECFGKLAHVTSTCPSSHKTETTFVFHHMQTIVGEWME